MPAIIKVNGMEVPESLAIVDTLSNEVSLETLMDGGVKLNLNEVYVEVNIIGNMFF